MRELRQLLLRCPTIFLECLFGEQDLPISSYGFKLKSYYNWNLLPAFFVSGFLRRTTCVCLIKNLPNLSGNFTLLCDFPCVPSFLRPEFYSFISFTLFFFNLFLHPIWGIAVLSFSFCLLVRIIWIFFHVQDNRSSGELIILEMTE